jgi:transcriptional antiterminator RfaH
MGDGPRWFVVKSNPGQEKLARYSLEEHGVEAYLPMTQKLNGRDELVSVPLFPSYLFARLTRDSAQWCAVFSARGVAAVLGAGSGRTPVNDGIVAAIRAREVDGLVRLGVADKPKIGPGSHVVITTGPFAAFEGVFLQTIDKRRCAVLLSLFSGSFRAEAKTAHVALAEVA